MEIGKKYRITTSHGTTQTGVLTNIEDKKEYDVSDWLVFKTDMGVVMIPEHIVEEYVEAE